MIKNVLIELFLPLIGTSLGAGCVFFLKTGMNLSIQRALTGFAAGVMVAAFGWVSCFCWFWTKRFPICTRAAISRKALIPG